MPRFGNFKISEQAQSYFLIKGFDFKHNHEHILTTRAFKQWDEINPNYIGYLAILKYSSFVYVLAVISNNLAVELNGKFNKTPPHPCPFELFKVIILLLLLSTGTGKVNYWYQIYSLFL